MEHEGGSEEQPTTEPPPPAAPDDPAALIFDLDGTLVDTVDERIEAWMRTFAEIGIPAERPHVAGLIGADGKRLALEVAGIAKRRPAAGVVGADGKRLALEVAGIANRRLSEDRAEAVDRRAGELFSELAAN